MWKKLHNKYRYSLILLRELVRFDFKIKYQDSILGYIWSVMKPLFMFTILYVVFVKILRVGEGIKLTLNENSVNFDLNKSTLTSTAKANLDKLVGVFKDYPDTNIVIYGHTDSSGDDAYNMNLSVDRAQSVKSYLSSRGLSSSRFEIVGMGETEPMDTNETASGRANNRRVEFAILANDKMIQDAENEAK